MANTFTTAGSDPNIGGVYRQVWATKLQERLTGPVNWKEILEVFYSDDYILNLPYMSTEYSLQSGTRGSAYSHSSFALTNDQLNINNTDIVSVFQDRADLAQSTLVNASEHGSRMGDVINERVEDLFLGQHASWTDIGSDGGGGFTAGSSQISIEVANIDSLVRYIKQKVIEAKGSKLMNRFGLAFVWRPPDYNKLEEAMAAQGFTFADMALKDGIMNADGSGKYAFGAYHYVSESHTANHVFAGVRKIQQVGLLKSTYGKIFYNPNAMDGNGPLSGVSWESRLDYGFNAKAGLTTILFDLNVAS